MNLRRLWAIARKETIHIRRDPRSLGLAIGVPLLMLLAFGYALTLDVDRVPFVVWDQSGTTQSRELVARFTGTPYFSLQGTVEDYPQLEHAIEDALLDVGHGADLLQGLAGTAQHLVDDGEHQLGIHLQSEGAFQGPDADGVEAGGIRHGEQEFLVAKLFHADQVHFRDGPEVGGKGTGKIPSEAVVHEMQGPHLFPAHPIRAATA